MSSLRRWVARPVTNFTTVGVALKDLENLLGRTPTWGGDRLVAAAYTIVDSDDLLLVDATAAARTITLPLAANNRGRTFWVKRTAGANTVTVQRSGAELIDGAATNVQNSAATVGYRACLTATPATYGYVTI